MTDQYEELIKRIENNDETLSEIDLHNMELNDDQLKNICLALMQNTHVIQLNLSNNMFSSEGLQYLMDFSDKCLSLEELNLSFNNLTGECLRWIATAVSNSNIKYLYMDSTNIMDCDICNLNPLMHGAHLIQLSMNDNEIGDDGFETLLSYLQNIPTLQRINIENNHITGRSIDAIADFVKAVPTIQDINIQGHVINAEDKVAITAISDYSACCIQYSESERMSIETTIESFHELVSITDDLYLRYACVLFSLQKQHSENLPLVIDSTKLKEDLSYCIISSQTDIAAELHSIREHIIDMKTNTYYQQDPQNIEAIQMVAENIHVLVQSLALPAVFLSTENRITVSLNSMLTNTAGSICRCGQLRIELVLLIATLIDRGCPNVLQYIIEKDVLSSIWDMLHLYPWNSILHNAIEVLFSVVFESPVHELVCYALETANLYGKIKRYLIDELVLRKQGQPTKIGYLGILVDLCIRMETLATQQPVILQIIKRREEYTTEELQLLQEAMELNGMIKEDVYNEALDYFEFS